MKVTYYDVEATYWEMVVTFWGTDGNIHDYWSGVVTCEPLVANTGV